MTKSFEEEMSESELKWQNAVGRFLISFGRVEWVTYQLLIRLPSERIFDAIKDQKFSHRVNLIKALAKSRIQDESILKELESVLGKANELAQYRNLLAHNPIDYSLYENDAGAVDLRHTISKFGAGNDKQITLETVLKKCHQVEKLSDEAHDIEIKICNYLCPVKI